jgi:hypothetical protein
LSSDVANTLQFITVVYPLRSLPLYINGISWPVLGIYVKPISWAVWGKVLIIVGIGSHIIFIGVGIWRLVEYGSGLIWATPVTFHAPAAILAITSAIGSLSIGLGELQWWRISCWMVLRLSTSGLSIAAAVGNWEFQHMVQCFLCVAAISEYAFWKWRLRPRSGSDRESLV